MMDFDLTRLHAADLVSLAFAAARAQYKGRVFHQLDGIESAHIPRPVQRSRPKGWIDPGIGSLYEMRPHAGHASQLREALRRLRASNSEALRRMRTVIVFMPKPDPSARSAAYSVLRNETEQLGIEFEVWDVHNLEEAVSRRPRLMGPFFERLSGADYLEHAANLVGPDAAPIARAMALHAASELTSKQWVRTGDAGYADSSKVRLAEIAVDLPCKVSGDDSASIGRPHAVASIVRLGEKTHRSAQGVVLLGGPGQGKSTIAQLVAHAYRISLLEGAGPEVLSGRAIDVHTSLSDRLARAGVARPQRRRWPIVVDLVDLAEWSTGPTSPGSLTDYLLARVIDSGTKSDPRLLLNWLASWPICLILDGLDEVPDENARANIFALTSRFVSTCNAERIDLLLLTTTRPHGYQGEMEGIVSSSRVTLLEFTEGEALAYSEEVNGVRNSDDPDLAAQVTDRLIEAIHERVTQRLMTTPLQVTIMTALAERAVDLPTSRYDLFDAYYHAIYDRESSKGKEFSGLRAHRSHIDHIHERVALELQKNGEKSATANALMPRAAISRTLVKRLVTAGYDEGVAKSISEDILKLSTERLVMLVAPRAGSYGFEVRSLQEYMAARALVDGEDEEVLRRLEILLPSGYWRNVWLLAIGRLLGARDRLIPRVASMISNANSADTSGLMLTGSSAALDLYLDQVAFDFPSARLAFLRSLLELCGDTDDMLSPTLSLALDTAASAEWSFEIVTSRLEELSRESDSNLATLYFDKRLASGTAIGDESRRILSGRRWQLRHRPDIRDRRAELANYLRRVSPQTPQIAEFAHLLSREVPAGKTVTWAGPADSEILASMDDYSVQAALIDVAASLRGSNPDIAHEAISLMRTRLEKLPRVSELDKLSAGGSS